MIARWIALTMPAVTVRSSPNGFPIATTGSPTCMASELPSGSGVRARELASIFSTARSLEASVPSTVAFVLAPFEKLTRTCLAPLITW